MHGHNKHDEQSHVNLFYPRLTRVTLQHTLLAYVSYQTRQVDFYR